MDVCPPILDMEAISDLLANIEGPLFSELVGSFLTDSDGRLRRIEASLDPLDRIALKKEAHSMKGASATYGAMRFGWYCGILESTAETAAHGELKNLVREMRSSLDETGPALVSHYH